MNAAISEYTPPSRLVVFTDFLPENAPCIYREPRNHESLFFVTEGALQYEKNGVTEVVPLHHIGYIARGSRDVSGPYGCPVVRYIAVNFSFSREDEAVPSLPFTTVCSQNTFTDYEPLFRAALDAYERREPGYQTLCYGLLLQIIGALYREQQQLAGEKALLRLRPAVTCLQERYADPELHIRDLAPICGITEVHLRRLFTALYGKTPFAFLQEIRIRHAQVLLRNTQKPVGEITLLCGFGDIYGFSHCFKRHTGQSPLHYREYGV